MRIKGIPYLQGAAGKSSTVSKTGVAIHATANPKASAENEAVYAARRDDGIGAHVFYDADSGVMSCDTVQRVGHAGSNNGNLNAVAVELTGANAWTRQQWIDRLAWSLIGDGLAQVCRAHGIPAVWLTVAQMKADPRTKGFYTHDDMRRAWGGTDHTDPGPNFPKDVLINAVRTALNGGSIMADTTPNEVNDWTGLRRIESLHKNLSHTHADTGSEPNGLHVKLEEILAAARADGWSQEQRDALAEDVAARVLAVLATKIGDVIVEAMIDPRVLEAYEAAAFRGAQRAEQE